MSIMEIISEAAQNDWESYHGPTDDGYIPQMPPAFMRGFLCGVAWAQNKPDKISRRVSTTGNMVFFNKNGNARGLISRLKNKRVSLGEDGERYLLEFKHLTDENKVHTLKFILTPDGMAELVRLFFKIKGPLPDGRRWEQCEDGSVSMVGDS